ncbi:MAG: hypothetical protein GY850_48165 [bacterium]|nr:hypothetical protein [bacterium]
MTELTGFSRFAPYILYFSTLALRPSGMDRQEGLPETEQGLIVLNKLGHGFARIDTDPFVRSIPIKL